MLKKKVVHTISLCIENFFIKKKFKLNISSINLINRH